LIARERRLLLKLPVVVQYPDAKREDVVDQLAIVIERVSLRAMLVERRLNAAAIAILGPVDRGVDDARRTAKTEQDRVRPALQIDAGNIIAVPRHVREKEIPRVVRRH